MYISTYDLDKPFPNLSMYHIFIENQFPNELKQKIRKRHLYRIEHKTHIILVSEDKPAPNKQLISTKAYDLTNFKTGNIYNFKLVANALKLGYTKRIPATTKKQALAWLESQAPKRGFEIVEAKTLPVTQTHVSSHHFTLSAWKFTGKIKVSNIELFRKALSNGIGREKAYGCGILTIN